MPRSCQKRISSRLVLATNWSRYEKNATARRAAALDWDSSTCHRGQDSESGRFRRAGRQSLSSVLAVWFTRFLALDLVFAVDVLSRSFSSFRSISFRLESTTLYWR